MSITFDFVEESDSDLAELLKELGYKSLAEYQSDHLTKPDYPEAPEEEDYTGATEGPR